MSLFLAARTSSSRGLTRHADSSCMSAALDRRRNHDGAAGDFAAKGENDLRCANILF
jgi:hypothetical protein